MSKRDTFQEITNQLLEKLENVKTMWEIPWVGMPSMPTNVHTKREYTGQNALSLYMFGGGHSYWGTYKQWKKEGAQVKKGQKAEFVLVPMTGEKENKEGEKESFLYFRGAPVFHEGQVEGWEVPERPHAVVDTVEYADAIVSASEVPIEHHPGMQAAYYPQLDVIKLAERSDFVGTANTTPTEAYYGTLLHELVHATGHESRVGRKLRGAWDKESYAAEELIAELGSAFLAAKTGISVEPREDNAAYIKSWIKVLKEDKRAFFTAASQAQKAVSWLMDKHAEKHGASEEEAA